MFGGSGPSAPPPPPPPPTIDSAEIAQQAAATRQAARKRKGMGASVLAGETPPSPDLVAMKQEKNQVLG